MENALMDNVFMKRTLVALFALSIVACASARAQVVPSATGSPLQLSAGGLGSILQPDFPAPCKVNLSLSCVGTSPNRVYGIGTYVDLRLSRWIQPEFEARWSAFNTQGLANREDTYLTGLRVPIHTFHKMHATPYGKFLIGWGRASGFLNPPTTLAMAYGAGIDLRVTKHFTLRAFDFEYQQWRVTPTLFPYEGSVGLSYRIF
jgi:hypothetical protein